MVVYLHLRKNGCAVVCNSDLAIWGNENLVETYARGNETDAFRMVLERAPLGPRDVRMIFATVRAARMFDYECINEGQQMDTEILTLIASIPWLLVFLACSRRMMNGRPYYRLGEKIARA